MTFNLNNIRVLHIEPTTVCNAACPQCARENPSKYNDATDRCDLTVSTIEHLFSKDFIKQLSKMFMCGNYGDPAATRESLNIFNYFRSLNSNIVLGMNTNGGIQNTNYWKELGRLLSQTYDYCVFSIDGLEDTNSIYRVNVRWNKLIDNVSAFINAGGNAHWDMLIFQHNQHQIDEARDLAKKLGFTHFRAKVSKRFISTPVVGVEPPNGFALPNVIKPNKINCHALNEKSLYVAANGVIYPCCWIGSYAFNMDPMLKQYLEYPYRELIKSWSQNPHSICSNTCGITTGKSSFEQQWNIDEVLQ